MGREEGRVVGGRGVVGDATVFVDGDHPGILFYSRTYPSTRYFVEWVITDLALPDARGLDTVYRLRTAANLVTEDATVGTAVGVSQDYGKS